jgi:holo-[acyl-carrier protein] synthase
MKRLAVGVHTGIDLVDRDRIKKALQQNEEALLDRICTPEEKKMLVGQQEASDQLHEKRLHERIAGIFALKESFSKALGTGIGGDFGFHDVEVSYSAQGQPRLTYSGESFGSESNNWRISCSVSHEGKMVAAVVVIQVP